MRIDDITEERLLRHTEVRHVQHLGENYFVVDDLNRHFEGAFRMLPETVLKVTQRNGNFYEMKACIPFLLVASRRDEYIPLSEFERSLKTMWRYRQ